MQSSPLVIGIILLVLGILGLAFNFYMGWMWVLVVLGIIGIIWGFVAANSKI